MDQEGDPEVGGPAEQDSGEETHDSTDADWDEGADEEEGKLEARETEGPQTEAKEDKARAASPTNSQVPQILGGDNKEGVDHNEGQHDRPGHKRGAP